MLVPRPAVLMSVIPQQTATMPGGRSGSVECHEETHARQQVPSYSMISSARASSVGGTVTPSALAVFRCYGADEIGVNR